MATSPLSVKFATNICCDSCGTRFVEDDEIFQSTIRYSIVLDDTITTLEQHHVQDDEGELRFDPILLHIECWETVVEGLKEALEDMPPIEDPEQVLTCTFCESSVREWEYYARVHIGELQPSPRAPEGEPVWRFIQFSKNNGSIMCLSCMSRVHDEVLEIWDDVSQDGECTDCSQDRCWREGECDCDCHTD